MAASRSALLHPETVLLSNEDSKSICLPLEVPSSAFLLKDELAAAKPPLPPSLDFSLFCRIPSDTVPCEETIS
jgi:hypothetical protein